MNVLRRTAPAIVVLLLIAAGELALVMHMNKHTEGAYEDLTAPLASLPLELRSAGASADPSRAWVGRDHPQLQELAAHLPYKADDILYRVYGRESGGAAVLYAVYSRIGEDRKHHPEICIRDVSGAPEELSARTLVPLDAEKTRFAARFRFITGPSSRTTVYYWHYTFPPLPRPERDWLQTLHLRLRHPSPSLTVQVSSTDSPAVLEAIEQTLVGSVDAALRARQLPQSAQVGCNRLPIGLTRE